MAAFLHIAIIIGGPKWYRFFGAGERMATLAGQGSLIPTISTLGIFGVLFIWGLYAFSGAGFIKKLPFLKPALLIISAIYLIRGLALFPVWILNRSLSPAFIFGVHWRVWSSVFLMRREQGGFGWTSQQNSSWQTAALNFLVPALYKRSGLHIIR